MKVRSYIMGLVAAGVVAVTGVSCTGLLMSSDFDTGSYGGVSGNWYWPSYGSGYNGPWYGSGWNAPTPPPPPPVVVVPSAPGNKPVNGANRPNYAPSQPSQPSRPSRPQQPVTTTPNGGERPGNMGQDPSQSGSSQGQRGR